MSGKIYYENQDSVVSRKQNVVFHHDEIHVSIYEFMNHSKGSGTNVLVMEEVLFVA